MRPISLKLAAFGPYRGEVALDFNQLAGHDFFLIHGMTGAGKTSIFDAICYALYGKTATLDRNGEMLRNQSASPNTETYVELTFKLHGKEWRIRRNPSYERAKKRGDGTTRTMADATLHELAANGDIVNTWTKKEVDGQIQSMLGFEVGQFRQVVLLPQGEFQKFLKADTTERQKIMKVLFNTGIYEKLEAKLKAKANDLKHDFTKQADRKKFLLDSVEVAAEENLASYLASEQATLKDNETKLAELLAVKNKQQQAKEAAQQLANQFAELDQSQQNLVAAKKCCEEDKPQTISLKKAKQAQLIYDIAEQKNTAAAKLIERDKVLQTIIIAGKALGAAVEKAEQALKEQNEQQIKRTEQQQEIGRLSGYLDKAKNLADYEKKIADVKATIKQLTDAQATSEKQLQQLTDEQQATDSKLEKLTDLAAKADGFKLQIDKLTQEKQNVLRLQALQQEITVANEELAALEKNQLTNQQQLAKNKALLTDFQELARIARAALLAENLTDGEPCPVCGAIHHPKLAQFVKGKITDETIAEQEKLVQKSQADYDLAQAAVNECKQKLLQLQTEMTSLKNSLSTTESLSAIEKALSAAQAEYSQAKQANDLKLTHSAKMAQLKATQGSLEANQKELANKLLTAKQELASNQAILQDTMNNLPDDAKNYQELQTKVTNLKAVLAKAEQLAQAATDKYFATKEKYTEKQTEYKNVKAELDASRAALNEVTNKYQQRLAESGLSEVEFLTISQSEWRAKNYCEQVEITLKQHEQNLFAASEQVNKLQTVLADKQMPDMLAITNATLAAEQALQEQQALVIKAKTLVANLEKTARELQKINETTKGLDEEYQVVSELANLANGQNTGRKQSLQSYVLQVALRDVLNSANTRLKSMTNERYRLTLGDAKDNRSDSGLELAIIDTYNGKSRPVQTLSGGESFLAALALALGLADVVQHYAGGISLDTMFIDEGFGTLDSETLDNALNALFEVQRGGRMVGIISHVAELKKRIPARLEVFKTTNGSDAKIIVGTVND